MLIFFLPVEESCNKLKAEFVCVRPLNSRFNVNNLADETRAGVLFKDRSQKIGEVDVSRGSCSRHGAQEALGIQHQLESKWWHCRVTVEVYAV